MKGSAVGCLALLAAACASVDPSAMEIVKDVEAIEPMAIALVCIEVNTETKAAFGNGLFENLRALGIATQSKQGAFGDECRHWLRYQATFGGLPEHLKTASIEVLDNRTVIGRIRYDATRAGSRPDRYGASKEKLKPLLEALFVRVER